MDDDGTPSMGFDGWQRRCSVLCSSVQLANFQIKMMLDFIMKVGVSHWYDCFFIGWLKKHNIIRPMFFGLFFPIFCFCFYFLTLVFFSNGFLFLMILYKVYVDGLICTYVYLVFVLPCHSVVVGPLCSECIRFLFYFLEEIKCHFQIMCCIMGGWFSADHSLLSILYG